MESEIIVALIAFAGTLIGSYFGQRKSTALIAYRLEQLESKVSKHNSVVEKTYILEEKMKVANHRIEDIELRIWNRR
ncbi:hypothetical protein [Sporanaerobacter acetigenes]|uniref:Uncharacterized protein n=1 Tax=Sporanaerobacter acetigenes DSM 13106 TaxID=1123281 RepID=A0A1M5TY69_9FIRM|nr:hypothetical protein [Sporanaerobacter acetigenes]SHH55689.1 hypothetical protein SAMN02745180_00468 [Sporanaerobacter acetigenes DSM 13106]